MKTETIIFRGVEIEITYHVYPGQTENRYSPDGYGTPGYPPEVEIREIMIGFQDVTELFEPYWAAIIEQLILDN